jgi:hypothetical protein
MLTRFFSRMLVVVVLVVVTGTLAPSAWGASKPEAGERGNYRGQCRRLTRQIDRYEKEVLPLAAARGNRAWQRATEEQVERLWHRRADLCPEYGAERTLRRRMADQRRRFKQFLVTAGRAAAAFFSGGATGF